MEDGAIRDAPPDAGVERGAKWIFQVKKKRNSDFLPQTEF